MLNAVKHLFMFVMLSASEASQILRFAQNDKQECHAERREASQILRFPFALFRVRAWVQDDAPLRLE